MLETTDSLLPNLTSTSSKENRPLVLCVGLDEDSMDELAQLLGTLGYETRDRVLVSPKRVNPATYVGKGKLDEIKETLIRSGAQAVIVDVELSPNQLRNIEKALGCPVLDRPGVIIEIFSRHARTKEAKTQVALARLQYLLPRLSHFWTHFERQRGGGTASRGMGEKQIEVDRRLVKQRISVLRGRLESVEKERQVQRAGRKDVLKVALVGYTNAGKSTLLNALTQSQVLAEDKLFATLDASVRSLDPNSHPPVVAIDTVGFISNLPPALVASFRSTLEELHEADLLLHVVDASHPKAREQLEVTEKILEELKLGGKPTLIVLNKLDLIQGVSARNQVRTIAPGAVAVSALQLDDAKRLRDLILEHFRKKLDVWEILVPYAESKLESQLHQYGSIEVKRHMEKGTFYKLRIEKGWAKKLRLDLFKI